MNKVLAIATKLIPGLGENLDMKNDLRTVV